MPVKYKKYLTDPNAQIPRRTLYRQIKKKNITKYIKEEEFNERDIDDDQQQDFNNIDIQEQQYQTYLDSSRRSDLNRDEMQRNNIEAIQIIVIWFFKTRFKRWLKGRHNLFSQTH